MSNLLPDLKIGVIRPSHHALGKFPEFFMVLNTLVKPFERISTLHLIISLLILSEYAAFFVFIFFAAFNISSIVISVSSRFFAFSLCFKFSMIFSCSFY